MATYEHARVLSLLGWDLVEMLGQYIRLKKELDIHIIPDLCAIEQQTITSLCEVLAEKIDPSAAHQLAEKIGISVSSDKISAKDLVSKFPNNKSTIYFFASMVKLPFQEEYEKVRRNTYKVVSEKKLELDQLYRPDMFTNLATFLTKIGNDPSAMCLLEGLRDAIPYAEEFSLEQVASLRKFLLKMDQKYPPAMHQKKPHGGALPEAL